MLIKHLLFLVLFYREQQPFNGLFGQSLHMRPRRFSASFSQVPGSPVSEKYTATSYLVVTIFLHNSIFWWKYEDSLVNASTNYLKLVFWTMSRLCAQQTVVTWRSNNNLISKFKHSAYILNLKIAQNWNKTNVVASKVAHFSQICLE